MLIMGTVKKRNVVCSRSSSFEPLFHSSELVFILRGGRCDCSETCLDCMS